MSETELFLISSLIAIACMWAVVPEITWLSNRIRSRFTKPKKTVLKLIDGGKKEKSCG